MNEPVIAQLSPGLGPKQNHRLEYNLTASSDRPLSEIVAQDNRFLSEVLSMSSKEYVTTSTINGDESITPRAARNYRPSITELLSQTCGIMLSRSRMALTPGRRMTTSKPAASILQNQNR